MTAPKSNDADFRPKARRPRGFTDRRGAALAAERAIVERVLQVYQAWGFERLETAAFEYADALGKFLPDQDRPNEGVFALQDDDGQWLSLRYDLTAPLARFTAEHYETLPKPFRRCAAGPVWRNEKPGPGRFREFWQCDADTVGSASPAADAEMIAMLAAAYQAAGLRADQLVIKVNTRRLLNAALDGAGAKDPAVRLAALRAIDKLDRLGTAGVTALLGAGRKDESGDFTKGAGLAPAAIEALLAFVGAGGRSRAETLANLAAAIPAGPERDAGLKELAAMETVWAGLGAGDLDIRFDPSIVRGLEYYTGPVFEAELIGEVTGEDGKPIRLGSIGSGGRYDDLVSRFLGQAIPATGCSVGVSRLAYALTAMAAEPPGPIVVLVMDQAAIAESFAMAAELRAGGVAAEVYLGAAGMKAQLKYADKRRAPIAVIAGEDERARGVVSLKNLRLGAKVAGEIGEDRAAWEAARARVQQETARERLVEAAKAMLDDEV